VTVAAIAVGVLLAAAGYGVIFVVVWAVYRFRTREERRRRRDLVRQLREVFDDADARGELTPQRSIEIADSLRRLHRG
jgi:flagellar biosynthesis/type III secretory pathway M-ring protein FliF/YscJ